MHQSPKCGLFPTVDKRYLQEGVYQERQAEIKKQQIANIINNIGVFLIKAFFISLFFYLILFGE